jgi:endonuclease/exonuclease/phosphatase family metal-dependent hydrolase
MGTFTKHRRVLTVVTTHFDFDASVQQSSARIIMNRIEQLQDSDAVILSGDFNATPEADWYRIFSQPDSTGEPFKHIFSPPYPGTHHEFSGKPGKDHIDWILYRGNVTNHHRQVITDTFGQRYPSDHFPLLASFHWRCD